VKDREQTIIAQVVAESPRFTRHIQFENDAGDRIDVSHKRQCRIVVGFNQDTGRSEFFSEDQAENIHLQDLPAISMHKASEIDKAEADRIELESLRKKIHSKKSLQIERGDPNYRIKKPDSSFCLGQRPSKLTGTKKAG